jgi:hypothetical protein
LIQSNQYIYTPTVKIQSIQSLCRNAGLTLVGSLTLSAVATVSQSEQAHAVVLDLNFTTPVETTFNTNPFNFNFGAGVGNNPLDPSASNTPTGSTGAVVVRYKNVAAGVDAIVTAKTFGTDYSFVEHIPNYLATNTTAPTTLANGKPYQDAAFLYQIAAGKTGLGGMEYTIDLFSAASTTYNPLTDFQTAYTAPDLRFLVYDVDGEAAQGEAVRIAKHTGLVGYQVGKQDPATPTINPLTVLDAPDSYLFSGHDTNYAETNTAGAAILYFQNVKSVNFQFEANTRTSSTNNNPVFSAIDGDLSLVA